MAISKDKKNAIAAKLTDALKDAVSVVFVRFHKLSVADTSALRRELKKEGVGYYVAKKTLIKRALSAKQFEGEVPAMDGEIAIAWSNSDATAPARLIHVAGKKYKEAIAIAGGVFENAFADVAKMVSIATIPPLPVLRGMFANIINTPRSRFAIALAEVAKTKTV